VARRRSRVLPDETRSKREAGSLEAALPLLIAAEAGPASALRAARPRARACRDDTRDGLTPQEEHVPLATGETVGISSRKGLRDALPAGGVVVAAA